MSELPPRLAEIVGEFQEVDRTERLDLLFEYAGDLPDLPAAIRRDGRAGGPAPDPHRPRGGCLVIRGPFLRLRGPRH